MWPDGTFGTAELARRISEYHNLGKILFYGLLFGGLKGWTAGLDGLNQAYHEHDNIFGSSEGGG